jgi:hypothetical protein
MQDMPDIIVEAPQITAEEYKKYRGKEVALYKNKIVAASNVKRGIRKSVEKMPEAKTEEIEIFYIQATDSLLIL